MQINKHLKNQKNIKNTKNTTKISTRILGKVSSISAPTPLLALYVTLQGQEKDLRTPYEFVLSTVQRYLTLWEQEGNLDAKGFSTFVQTQMVQDIVLEHALSSYKNVLKGLQNP